MAVRRQSIAFEEDVLREVRASAARAGLSVSAWLNRAARRGLMIERGLAAGLEWEAENRPLSKVELARADRALGSHFE